MSRFDFEPFDDDDGFDLDGIGITADDLNLDGFTCDTANLSALLTSRPRYERRGHWSTTDAEEHFLGLPPFQSMSDRAAYFVEMMGRAYLDQTGGGEDDPVFPYLDQMLSLNDLLAMVSDDPAGNASSYLQAL